MSLEITFERREYKLDFLSPRFLIERRFSARDHALTRRINVET